MSRPAQFHPLPLPLQLMLAHLLLRSGALEAGLERAGVDVTALRRQGRLHLVSGKKSGDALLAEMGERVKTAVHHGEPLVRVFGNLGWDRPGWPPTGICIVWRPA